jgi:glycosyltransferase involved in cell wall biosynthesis
VSAPLLSVVVPTIGRPTLERTLRSLRYQAPSSTLEIVVVGDTHQATYARALGTVPYLCDQFEARYLEHDGGLHCVGQPQRQRGQAAAHGLWLAWLQDDDVWAANALATIRPFLAYVRPLLFRAETRHGGTVWREPRLEHGNVDANCLVVPNVPARLGRWLNHYDGDYAMIAHTVGLWQHAYWPPPLIALHDREPVAT